MRVDPRPNLGVAAPARRAGARPAFAPAEGRPADASHAAAGPASLAGMDAILALQADTGDATERRRRAAHRGRDLLDALDRLKAALLAGRVLVADLKAVAARLAERLGPSGDARLDEILAHIELRAAVEMAKLERAGTA